MNKIISAFLDEADAWISAALRSCPGRIGTYLRYRHYKLRFRACGKNVRIAPGCYIRDCRKIEIGSDVSLGIGSQLYAGGDGTEQIRIGSDVSLNSNVMINADVGGRVEIGAHCLVGPNVVFRTSGHVYTDRNVPIREQGHKPGTIVVGDNVWIGANTVISGNIVIGEGAIIAACSLVTRNIKSYTIAGGVPAEKLWTRS
jgi:galactoside O-acetyltransferase